MEMTLYHTVSIFKPISKTTGVVLPFTFESSPTVGEYPRTGGYFTKNVFGGI